MKENASLDGATLLHGDTYPFNTMMSADRVFVVDWPHAWVGPRRRDAVTLLSNAALRGVDVGEEQPCQRQATRGSRGRGLSRTSRCRSNASVPCYQRNVRRGTADRSSTGALPPTYDSQRRN
ncbi:hypothetical protein ACFY8S_33325 [Streptomyces hygroscopicus]|uniref:hypothetical protein n=1 Tax=Streptomyces hygroscopicus TaxID=1912 RepID=UPI0036A0D0F5